MFAEASVVPNGLGLCRESSKWLSLHCLLKAQILWTQRRVVRGTRTPLRLSQSVVDVPAAHCGASALGLSGLEKRAGVRGPAHDFDAIAPEGPQ